MHESPITVIVFSFKYPFEFLLTSLSFFWISFSQSIVFLSYIISIILFFELSSFLRNIICTSLLFISRTNLFSALSCPCSFISVDSLLIKGANALLICMRKEHEQFNNLRSLFTTGELITSNAIGKYIYECFRERQCT